MLEKRTSANISLDELSGATGISTGVLRILENDDREHFPAEVYTRGFYKKYAEFLGLDPEEILAAYQQLSTRPNKGGGSSRYDFNTVVTLKGQEESFFVETARRLILPVIILLCGALLYWVYTNYLSSYNPLDYFK